MDKTGRNGLRVGDLLENNFREKYDFLVSKHKQLLTFHNYEYDLATAEKEWFDSLASLKELEFVDSEHYLNAAMQSNKRILAEGAQGSLLDIDFGTYPFVTSSNTVTAGACTGLGIAPGKIGRVIGIFKAYCTRVGSGPFPSELLDDTGERMRQIGREFGSTTGRPRRCGWLDLPALKYAIMINGVTEMMMMKADVLNEFDEIKVCTAYQYKGKTIDYLPYSFNQEDLVPQYVSMKGWKSEIKNDKNNLPSALNAYISFIEKETGVPISIVSVGPDRTQTIMMKEELV
jgi:adenylosuccinate synthase